MKMAVCVSANIVMVLAVILMGVHGNTNNVLTFYAEEEVTVSRDLGNIVDMMNSSDLQGWDFTLNPNSYSQFFEIRDRSHLYLKEKLDREDGNLCSPQTECKIRLEILAKSGSAYELLYADVVIVDINDNIPTFSSGVLNLDIPEGTAMSSSYGLPSAFDYDIGSNSIQHFLLKPEGAEFGLEYFPNPDGTWSLNLVLNLTLDRETQANYQLYVLAVDGGSSPSTGSVIVNINVTDINDNRPVFNPNNYNVTIDENIEIGTEIVTVTATDRDVGENARLSYYITNPNSNLFGIEESSGKIVLLQQLNTQTGPFTLFVEAKDHGEPVRKSFQAKVTINVRDINNNGPEITINTLSEKPYAQAKENANIGDIVAFVKVNDADTGLNGEAQCSCDNTNFSIGGGSGNLFSIHVAAPFDREEADSYEVSLNCSDKGVPPLTATKTFTVRIEDVNDNMPKFSMNIYAQNVTENNFAGAVLLKVTASDADFGENARIIYSIVPFVDEAKFHINESTGIISAVEPFDRETKDRYTFTVKASDNSTEPLFDLATVVIRIKDQNDNAPQFIGDSYSMSVLENANISTNIGQVTTTDDDLGVNGKISYSIPSEYSSYPFDILDDGTVVTTDLLDREHIGLYQFEIIASDHGDPVQSSRLPISVTILDINDNPPLIEFPYGDNDTISVPHNAQPNTVIATVFAKDADEKQNQELSYSILAGNDEELFYVNAKTGEISLTRKISDGDIKQFTLTISVKDNGPNQLETRGTLHVSIFKATDPGGLSDTGSGGQNILIVIIIICVTFVLSMVIITAICIIRRTDRKNKLLYNDKAYDEQKIIAEGIRNSNRSSSSRGSGDKMLYQTDTAYVENGYNINKKRNKVSFSMDEDQDTGISMETSGDQFDAVSTFKSPSPALNQPAEYENYQQEVKTSPSEKSEDASQGEILRMASLRVHQAMIKTNYNNNNNKQWPQTSQDEHLGRGYSGLTRKGHLDDTHSESSGETTTSDSGRGGSEEDIRSNMTNSHDTDESRSPNTSSSHPFYTADNQHLSFKSFHGSSNNKSGPILSSFLKKKQNRQLVEERHAPHYPMNDLSNPNKNMVHHSYSPYRTHSDADASPRNSGSAIVEPQYGSQTLTSFGKINNNLDDHVLHSPMQLPGRHGNTYEESVTGLSQDDDNTTTTSGSFTLPDLHDEMLASDAKDMFYKPDTFV